MCLPGQVRLLGTILLASLTKLAFGRDGPPEERVGETSYFRCEQWCPNSCVVVGSQITISGP